jgi:hypothetical protein
MPDTLARHKSPAALILVDVINHFEFPDGQRILRHALPIAPRLTRLKARARKAGIPCIYVNDNFGQWRSDAAKLVAYCLRPESAGRKFVEALRPGVDDYFVLKPMHSAFFQTPLEILLRLPALKIRHRRFRKRSLRKLPANGAGMASLAANPGNREDYRRAGDCLSVSRVIFADT